MLLVSCGLALVVCSERANVDFDLACASLLLDVLTVLFKNLSQVFRLFDCSRHNLECTPILWHGDAHQSLCDVAFDGRQVLPHILYCE